jgi:hypothetical protein
VAEVTGTDRALDTRRADANRRHARPTPPLGLLRQAAPGQPAAKATPRSGLQGDEKSIETSGERPASYRKPGLNVGTAVGVIQILDRQDLRHDENGEELGSSATTTTAKVTSHGKGHGPQLLRGTCTPAVFPGPERAPYPQPAGCTLPPSHYIACGRPGDGQYYADVTAAVEQ